MLWKQPRVEPSQAQTVYESSSKIRLSLRERRGGELSTAIPSLVFGLQLRAFLKGRNANLRHCSVSFLHPQRDQVTDNAGPLLPPIPTSDFENTNTYEVTPQCSGFFFLHPLKISCPASLIRSIVEGGRGGFSSNSDRFSKRSGFKLSNLPFSAGGSIRRERMTRRQHLRRAGSPNLVGLCLAQNELHILMP